MVDKQDPRPATENSWSDGEKEEEVPLFKRFNRRSVIKSIGAASAVSAFGLPTFSGVASAESHEKGGDCGVSECTAGCNESVPLWAAAGQRDTDKGTLVGQISITSDGATVTVTYSLNDPYEFAETHLYVGLTCPEELGSDPGQFPFSSPGEYVECTTNDQMCTYEIPYSEIQQWSTKGKNGNGKWVPEGGGAVDGDQIYVATHAVVEDSTDDEWEETAWAEGCAFGKSWAWYFGYNLATCGSTEIDSLAVGYEDLPQASDNDWDYNDFLLNISATSGKTGSEKLTTLTFDFTPKARGAAYTHEFRVQFPKWAFDSDGDWDLTVWDGSGAMLSSESGDGELDSSANTDIKIFKDTSDIFLAGTNSKETQVGCVDPGRTARLRIAFDDPTPWNERPGSSTGPEPHGGGLRFDPVLKITETTDTNTAGYEVLVGDVRVVTVPEWNQWVEERNPIWEVYTDVEEETVGGTIQPSFKTSNWKDDVDDDSLLFTNCS